MRKKSRAKNKARSATSSRRHEVKANLANFELAKARSSLTLDIYARGVKIGELEIGRGSLYWQGRTRKKSKRLNWSKFAGMMDKLAYGETSSAVVDEPVAPARPRRRRKASSRRKPGARKKAATRRKPGARRKSASRKKVAGRKRMIGRKRAGPRKTIRRRKAAKRR